MRHRKEKQQKRLGVMQLERQIEELPGHQRVLMRFGFCTDLRTDAWPCFVWIRQQKEVKALMPATPVKKDRVLTDVRAVEVALTKLSEDMQQLCALRVRWSIHSALNC